MSKPGRIVDFETVIAQAKERADALPKMDCVGCGAEIVEDKRQPRCWTCQRRHEEAERRRASMAARVASTRLDPDTRARVLDGKLDATVALQHVKAWGPTKSRGLVLCGGVGCGKTVAAAYAMTKVPHAVYCHASELPQRTDPWGNEAERYSDFDPSTEWLVVLDDLGTESDSARFKEAIERFVDCRVAYGRTIITTNLRKAEIRPRYGDRIADRLNHLAIAREIADTSLRRKGDL